MKLQSFSMESETACTVQYVTFYLGDRFFGIPVTEVQELVKCQEITPVPLAPPEIEGLTNLRGQIVTAINLRHSLRLGPRPAYQSPMNIVVRSEEGAISLVVDELGDIIDVPVSTYERPPSTMPAHEKDLISDVCKLEDRLLLVLNTGYFLQNHFSK